MAQVRDKNRIPKVLKEIARINQREARVGVFDDAPNLVRIAELNEFGVDQQLDETLHKRLRALAREYNAPTNTLPKPGERFRVPNAPSCAVLRTRATGLSKRPQQRASRA